MDMQSVFNALVFLGLLALGVRLKRYHLETQFMEYRFRYFALRDRLGHLAATGVIGEDSDPYRLLVTTLNYYIRRTERIDLFYFVRSFISWEADPEHRRRMSELVQECRVSHPEVSDIMHEFERLTLHIVMRHSSIVSIMSGVQAVARLPGRIGVVAEKIQIAVAGPRERMARLAT